MAYTNLVLLRRLVGDPGDAAHTFFSGDGAGKIFYLASPPIAANSQSVYVAGVLKAETTDYTLDDVSGKLTFGTAPAAGTDNILADYTAVRAIDADLVEALRLYSIVDSDPAEIGPSSGMVRAAIEVCEWTARRYSDAVDITTDGQSIARSQIAIAFANRAKELRVTLATERSGLAMVTVLRQDGYNASRQVTSDEVFSTGENPRRRYYGQPDRVP